jgi:hypothetical protein
MTKVIYKKMVQCDLVSDAPGKAVATWEDSKNEPKSACSSLYPSMLQYSKGDKIEFTCVFGNESSLAKVEVEFHTLTSAKNPSGVRPLNDHPNPLSGPPGAKVTLYPDSLGSNMFSWTFSSSIDGRWSYKYKVYDAEKNEYHITDPEAQLGNGYPP